MSHYVYLHRRNDTGEVFYVGKGSGRRMRSKQGRNPFWRAVAAKAGYTADVMVGGLDEELALLAEMEAIDALRRRGVRLTNLTDGGEGMTGYKMPASAIASRVEKTRGRPNPNISAALRGRPKSEAHRMALSAARTGTRATEVARLAMSEAQRRARPRKHVQLALRIGHRDSEETRAKKSAARQGAKNPRFGLTVPEEQKARQIATLRARPKVSCPHCERVMDESNAKRWHFDNCKEKS